MSKMMEYRGYHATIEYNANDEIFEGKVFGIADSLNFHGSTVVELKEMFKQSIDNYLELCEKIGKEPDKEFKGTFNVRIPQELHREAALQAYKLDISLNQYVQNCIENTLSGNNLKITEKIIYVPVSEKIVSFEGVANGSDNYTFGVEIKDFRKENMIYEASLS